MQTNVREMGAWGPLLFESDDHLDIVDKISADAKIKLWYPEDPAAIKAELDSGKLADLFDSYDESANPITVVFLGALALQLGAKIRDKDLELIGIYVKDREVARYLGEGKKQIELALKEYKNDGARYDFESAGVIETMASGTSFPPGHLEYHLRGGIGVESNGGADAADGVKGQGEGIPLSSRHWPDSYLIRLTTASSA